MASLVYSAAALRDLDAIFDFIANDNPPRAAKFVQTVRDRCVILCSYPELGIVRPEYGVGIRVYPLRGRVVVAYRVAVPEIQIMRVFYGGQDYDTILRSVPD